MILLYKEVKNKMEFSTSNYQDIQTREKVQEIDFSIKSINAALKCAEECPSKRILVNTTFKLLPEVRITADRLVELTNKYPNLYINFYELNDMIEFAEQTKKNHKYMYAYPVTTWNLINVLLRYEVPYITLGEPLVFGIQKCKNLMSHKATYPVKIKVCPHIAGTQKDNENPIRHFWFLPQHIPLYEEFVDVIILSDVSTIREKTLVDVYTSANPYKQSIGLLIGNLDSSMGGLFVDDDWVRKRMCCHQVCVEDDRRCHYCDAESSIYEAIKHSDSFDFSNKI